MAYLIKRASKFKYWQLAEMDPRELYNECSDKETIAAYQEDIESLPPIVVVPTTEGPYKYEILDGAHRAAAAEAAHKRIMAYRPLECVPGAGVKRSVRRSGWSPEDYERAFGPWTKGGRRR